VQAKRAALLMRRLARGDFSAEASR
jgi:hypothetical protein